MLLRLEVNVVAFERGAFLRGEIGQGLVVIGERANFLAARGGQGVLILQHVKGGGLADGVGFLLGVQRGLGVNARLPRGVHALIARTAPVSRRCQSPP